MPVKKEPVAVKKTTTPRKTTTRTPAVKKAPTEKLVEANARHIEENTQEIKNNSSMIHLLYGAIIFLLLIIAGLAFYVGQMVSTSNVSG
jgi:hypothetical protein